MKKAFFILFISWVYSHAVHGQIDSSSKTSNSIGREAPFEIVVIVDNYVIYDTLVSYPFLQQFGNVIKRRKVFSVSKGYKKFGIISKDGILQCFLKKGTKINFEAMGITEKLKPKGL